MTNNDARSGHNHYYAFQTQVLMLYVKTASFPKCREQAARLAGFFGSSANRKLYFSYEEIMTAVVLMSEAALRT